MRRTVIHDCLVASGDLHDHGVVRFDRHFAVNRDKCDNEVGVIVQALLRQNDHRILADQHTAGHSDIVILEILLRVERIADINRVTVYTLQFSVVRLGVRVTGKRYRDLSLQNLQNTFLNCDHIVAGNELLGRRVRDRVEGLITADIAYTAFRFQVVHFAFHESVAFHCHLRSGQCSAVIRLLRGLAYQLHVALVNAQCTVVHVHTFIQCVIRDRVSKCVICKILRAVILHAIRCRRDRQHIAVAQRKLLSCFIIRGNGNSAVRYRILFLRVALTVISPACVSRRDVQYVSFRGKRRQCLDLLGVISPSCLRVGLHGIHDGSGIHICLCHNIIVCKRCGFAGL